jgi:hypothetical protein
VEVGLVELRVSDNVEYKWYLSDNVGGKYES